MQVAQGEKPSVNWKKCLVLFIFYGKAKQEAVSSPTETDPRRTADSVVRRVMRVCKFKTAKAPAEDPLRGMLFRPIGRLRPDPE